MHQVVEILNSMSKSVRSGEFNFFYLQPSLISRGVASVRQTEALASVIFFRFLRHFFFHLTPYM